jgi:hypothetical protein
MANTDRFYKGAFGLAPVRCYCGLKLPKITHGNPLNERQGTTWHTKCKCHAVYQWSWHDKLGSAYRHRHELPLFDTREYIPDNMGKR